MVKKIVEHCNGFNRYIRTISIAWLNFASLFQIVPVKYLMGNMFPSLTNMKDISREICQRMTGGWLRLGAGEETLMNGEDSRLRPPDTKSVFLYVDEQWWWSMTSMVVMMLNVHSQRKLAPFGWAALQIWVLGPGSPCALLNVRPPVPSSSWLRKEACCQ